MSRHLSFSDDEISGHVFDINEQRKKLGKKKLFWRNEKVAKRLPLLRANLVGGKVQYKVRETEFSREIPWKPVRERENNPCHESNRSIKKEKIWNQLLLELEPINIIGKIHILQ